MDEELAELKAAMGDNEKIEEAADVFESVIGYVSLLQGISRENAIKVILAKMDNKFIERGGFDQHIILRLRNEYE